MEEQNLFDRTYNFILTKLVETGQAPHYTEIATALGVPMEEGRKVLHDLISQSGAAWLFPGTDYITSFPPFNNLPTQYRITVNGQQKWFAQWGFESLAVSWLFPGETVQIDFPCLDCGIPIHIEMLDGVVLKAEPKKLMGYVSVPYAKWAKQWSYTWSTMNLFRSEEHVRNWAQFDPESEEGIISLDDIIKLFSCDHFRRRLEPDYFSRKAEYRAKLFVILAEMGKKRPFWLPPNR